LTAVRGAIDTLIVTGGEGAFDASEDARVVQAVRRLAGRSRRVTSVCTGSFVLAAAGLLHGKRATTHWVACDYLARLHPEITVEPDPIFVRDGNVWTSAGVTAGMDLALALVAEDRGRDVALRVARQLVMYVQRPGGQSQFSAQLGAQFAARDPLRELQTWINEHPEADHAVERLAARVAMSPRHFARVFRGEVGCTPAQYVERVRLEVARRLLETTSLSVEEIARGCGFGTVETLRRAFARRVGATPTEYRHRFRSLRSA
jgi:transcriptional regulator GlxA family with amidase domain